MSEDTRTDCKHNLNPEDIQLDMTLGEEIEPMCEGHAVTALDLKHREKELVEFKQKVEKALIISILGTLYKKDVITKTVYENAVNIAEKQC